MLYSMSTTNKESIGSNSHSTNPSRSTLGSPKILAEPQLKMDQGYSWVMVFAAFLTTFSTWGVNSAYSVYFAYYLNHDQFKGAREIDYSAIGGLSFGVGLFSGPLINYIQGWIGLRNTMLLGAIFQFSAALMASWAVSLWELYLTQGLLQGFGLAFMSLPALTFISGWFVKKRVLANLLAVTGSGMGGLTFTLGLQKLIEVKGFSWALRAQAIITFSLLLIAIALVRDRSKAHKVEFTLYDPQVVKTAGFWLFVFYLVTCIFGYVIVLYSLPDYTITLGYSSYQGSIVGAMVQLGFCFGRPLAGFLADFYGAITITVIFYYIASIITLALWIPGRNYASAIALGLCEGLFIGALFSTSASSLVHLGGLTKLNTAFSSLWCFLGIAAVFSQIVGTAMTLSPKSVDTYRNTAIFAGVCFFVAATSNLILRGYLIAREKIYNSQSDVTDRLDLVVPILDPFKNCFVWSRERY